ncbi:hypothetical protein FHS42_006432 [Streptomyces zagrosensis]|uniref:Uncharacterized protein n=1 Tax=Streptomyces zagrosensis TaxID=1042984 RepID=A0A7W9QG05_9ACTN|nr:hypothetical protein [Streptomyces zagrosensis]
MDTEWLLPPRWYEISDPGSLIDSAPPADSSTPGSGHSRTSRPGTVHTRTEHSPHRDRAQPHATTQAQSVRRNVPSHTRSPVGLYDTYLTIQM